MPDTITITISDSGNPALDGTYPIEVPLTNRDLHDVKRIAGVRVGEIEDALEAGDNDVVVAFAYIGLRRNSKPVDVELLWDLGVGLIQVQLPQADAESDADPPPPRLEHAEPVGVAPRLISSGAGSPSSTENQDSDQSPTGVPRSAIGQGYA